MSTGLIQNDIRPSFSERVLCDYNLLEQKTINIDKQIIVLQMEKLSNNGKSIIFENQQNIANEVVNTFKNREIINVMVISMTQSGKTGSMCAAIKLYYQDSNNLIPIENIYIITGLSSCEWKEQTKERMPECIQNRVFHRCELPKTFVDEIKNKRNILIIMDEIQVAAKKEQTIYKAFKKAGLLNKSRLYENDIKILEYTATPDGTIYDLMKWNEASKKILGTPGQGYVSSFKLLQDGRVKQYKELCGFYIKDYLLSLDKDNIFDFESFNNDSIIISDYIIQNVINDIMYNMEFNEDLFNQWFELNQYQKYNSIIDINVVNYVYKEKKEIFKNIIEIKNDIQNNYTNPLYHIIRTKNGIEQEFTIRNFEKIFNVREYEFIKHDKNSGVKDINKTLLKKPRKHTFIFIKEMLRCAKTLEKQFIGILYDRYSKNPDDTTIIQGLIGRDTGYDNNGFSICYTNIDSIQKYNELWESNFEDTSIQWNSKTTSYKNGITYSKNTFQDPIHYNENIVINNNNDNNDNKGPNFKLFGTYEEAKEHYIQNIEKIMKGMNGRGPTKRKPDENGYYLSTIGRGSNRTRVRTIQEIRDVCKWGLNKTHHYTFHPCYIDINDKSTLRWALTYY